MDFCKYVNSRDIRNYLRETGYEFNSKEAAWLIYQCNSLTLDEKYDAWKQLMKAMPDYDLGERFGYLTDNSLFELIRKFISYTKQQYELFKQKEDGVIFQYRFYCTDDHDWCKEDGIYATLEDCWNAIEEDMDLGIEVIEIKKKYIGSCKYIEIRFSPDKAVLDISANQLSDEEGDVLFEGFDSFWFDFPVPFEKGDILAPVKTLGPRWKWAENGPVVMDGITPLEEDFNKRTLKRLHGDSSDMDVWGFFQDDDGRVFHEVTFNYMDFEYYEGPFEGPRRLLIAISNFLKGKISLDLLLCAYRKVIMDEVNDDVMLHSWYTEEGLRQAGLNDVIAENNSRLVASGLDPNKTFFKRHSLDIVYDWSNNTEIYDKCRKIAGNYHQPKEMLYVYGRHGCGKTTILQCLGNYAKQLSRRNLLYITAENFVSDVIGAIRSSDATTMATLREKYRSLDFLIIEDIQFFCGKEASTQEFYHTLNDLLTAGAQVVISADRPLDELNLPEELKSKISFATQMEMK